MGCLWIRLSGSFICHRRHGCQTVFSQTKNTNFDLFWKTLLWKLLAYVISHADLWVVLCKLDLFYSNAYGTICCYLIHIFFPIWYVVLRKNLATLPGCMVHSHRVLLRNSRSEFESHLGVRGPVLTLSLGAIFDLQVRSYPTGVNFDPLGGKLSPGDEILCLPLHSSKQ
jgi:hypothetical protein